MHVNAIGNHDQPLPKSRRKKCEPKMIAQVRPPNGRKAKQNKHCAQQAQRQSEPTNHNRDLHQVVKIVHRDHSNNHRKQDVYRSRHF